MEQPGQQIIARTESWMDRAVIGLNLCPFAKSVKMKGQIHYQVSQAKDTEQLLRDLIVEMKKLVATDPAKTDTALLIHPYVLEDFLDYNDFLEVADATLVELEMVGVLQIASFHPQYQFHGTNVDDAENYTNRSPFQMLHLLREDSVEKAIASYSDTASIPDRNIETLNNMSPDELKKLNQ